MSTGNEWLSSLQVGDEVARLREEVRVRLARVRLLLEDLEGLEALANDPRLDPVAARRVLSDLHEKRWHL